MNAKLVAIGLVTTLLLVFSVLLSGCDSLVNSNYEVDELTKAGESKDSSKVEIDLDAIFQVALEEVPIEVTNNFAAVVLKRERSDTRVLVQYVNEQASKTYNFYLEGEKWKRGKLEEDSLANRAFQEKDENELSGLYLNVNASGESKPYTATIARTYYKDEYGVEKVRDENWFINNDTDEGDAVVPREYVTNLPRRAVFLPGTQTNNGKIWTVSFLKWEYQRTVYPAPFSKKTSFSQNANTYELDYGTGEERPSNRLWIRYYLTIEPVASPPSAPALVSPANGATVGLCGTIGWNASSGYPAPKYNPQISTNSSFTSTVVNVTNLSSTSYQYKDLVSNTTYYWRVKASNSSGTATSSVRNFRTQSATLNVSYISGTFVPCRKFLLFRGRVRYLEGYSSRWGRLFVYVQMVPKAL